MNEATNIKINLMVTPTIWSYLEKLDNYSAYIRQLIENDLKPKSKPRNNVEKNKKLSI